MDFGQLLRYFEENAGAEYNMLSLINTINSDNNFRFKRIGEAPYEDNGAYFMLIGYKFSQDNFAILYYNYTYCKDNDIYDYDNNIMKPISITFVDTFEKIYFGKSEV